MISIFLDTNILFSRSKDFTIAGFRENLENIIAEIEVNDVYDKVQIVIPRLVLEELKMQQFEAHSELAAKFKNVRFTNQAIEISHDYYSKVCDIFSAAEEEIVQSSTVTVLIEEHPPGTALWGIIKRAIQKVPPFEGRGKESDKGFKDAIIWESVLEFKRHHPQNTVILFSGDKRIADEFLQNEYHQLFGEDIFLLQRKDTNSFDELIRQVLSLLNEKQMETTHDQELKEQLLHLICDDLVEPLYLDALYHYHDIDWEVAGATIENVTIEDAIDEDDTVAYSVLVTLCFHFKDKDELQMTDVMPCAFEFIYSLTDSCFYLNSFALPDGNIENLIPPLEIE